MANMTVPSAVSREEVARVLASQLGPKHPVKPMDNADSFHVGKGPFRVRVDVLTGDETTTIKVVPFGLAVLRAVNSMGIGQKVETALQQSDLHAA